MNRKRYVSAAKSRNSLEQEKKRMRGSLRGACLVVTNSKAGVWSPQLVGRAQISGRVWS